MRRLALTRAIEVDVDGTLPARLQDCKTARLQDYTMSFDTDRFIVLNPDETPLQAKLYEVLYNGLEVPSVDAVQSHVDHLSSVAQSLQQETLCALSDTPKLASYMWNANYSLSNMSSMYDAWSENRTPVSSLRMSLFVCVAAFLCRVLRRCVHRRMLYRRHCKVFKVC